MATLRRHAPYTLALSWLVISADVFAENFPESEFAARKRVAKVRQLRGESSEDWSMEDLSASLLARVKPMRVIGVDVVNAALRAFRVLWPDEPRPSTMEGLIRFLDATDDRLQEWRESSARAGADEAMKVVLSWYEGIKLEVLRGIRTNGEYVTNPEWIKKRQEIAYSFLDYIDLSRFVEDPADAEEEEEDEDAGDEEGTEADNNAPTAGADKGKGVVDADSNPGSSAPTASGSGRVA